jgi:dimethylargininase
MQATIALTREVSPALSGCELTHLDRVPIDVARAVAQHAAYERALQALGCSVSRLLSDATMPDSVFVEDTALVLDDLAVVTRPGAASRRHETIAVGLALGVHRRVIEIAPPGTLDGGDVLVVGRRMFVGHTTRTNRGGIEQLRQAVAPFGYDLRPVTPRCCLHLKSAATALGDATLLVNPRWAPVDAFHGLELIEVDPAEPGAANVVHLNGKVLGAAAFPRTLARLEHRGFEVVAVDVSELAKAEGAVTCCSLIFRRESVANDR